MTCNTFERLLATRRDLLPDEEHALQTHVRSCARCAAAWQREQRTTQLLQSLPAVQTHPSPLVTQEIRARLTRPPRRRKLQLVPAVVVALCCLILVSALAAQAYPQQVQQLAARFGLPFVPKQDHLYVVGYKGNPDTFQRLAVFDPTTYEQLLTVAGVDDIVMSPDGSRVYAGTRDQLLALNTATLREAWRVSYANRVGLFAIDDFPPTLAVSPDGRWLYVLTFERGAPTSKDHDAPRRLQVIDAATGQAMPHTVPFSAPACRQFAQFVSPRVGTHMLVGCDNELHVLNTNTQQWEMSVAVAGAVPGEFVASSDGRIVYATTYEPATETTGVVQINVQQRTVTPIPAISREAVTEGRGGNVFLTNDGSELVMYRFRQDATTKAATSTVCVYDTNTWQQEHCVQIDAGLFRPQLSADGTQLYGALMQPSGILDTLAAVDVATGQVLATHQLTDSIAGRVRVEP